MKLCKFIIIILGIVRSIPFNFKSFPLKIAYKLPIIISPFVCLKENNGIIKIENSKIEVGMIRIGFGGVGIFDSVFSRTIWQVSGTVIFKGKTNIGHGSKISVGKLGKLEIGDNFIITAESSIICHKSIRFGNNNLISWENLFLDTDFHKIYNLNRKEIININKEIIIKDNVWIGCRNTFLKGTNISKNSIVASNSVINKEFLEENILIAGNPAKIVKKNVKWEL